MSTLKTHNLQSPDAGSVNIALTANAGMIVTGISTFNDRINIGSLGVTTNFTVAGLSTFSDNVILAEQKELRLEPSGAFKLYRGPGGGGANNFIKSTFGSINLEAANSFIVKVNNSEDSIAAYANDRVDLYHNNQIKLTTTTKGIQVGTGVTIETNGQATYTGIVTATAFKLANGSDVGTGAGGTWSTYTAGIATSKSVGVNTSNLDDTDLTGIGNSFKGLYISNGMIVHDNVLNGNHYIGTSMNGLMAGPVTINGNLEIDGNYVVV